MNLCAACGHSTFFDWTEYKCPKCGTIPPSVHKAFAADPDQLPADIQAQLRAQAPEPAATSPGDPQDATDPSIGAVEPASTPHRPAAAPLRAAQGSVSWTRQSAQSAEALAGTLDTAGKIAWGAGAGLGAMWALGGLVGAASGGRMAVVTLVLGLGLGALVVLVAHALSTLLAGLGAIVLAQSATASATVELLRLERRRDQRSQRS